MTPMLPVDTFEYREVAARCAAWQTIAEKHCALTNLLGQAAAFEAVMEQHGSEAYLFTAPGKAEERVGYSQYWRYTIRRRANWLDGRYHYTFEVTLL